MELEEAKNTLLEIRKELAWVEDVEAIDTVISELFAMQNLLDEKNEELDRLQKENEEFRKLEKDHNYSVQVIRENSKLRYELAHSVSCDKIRKEIKKRKQRLSEFRKAFEGTYSDEQEYHDTLFRMQSKIIMLENLLKEE